ncbi:MAG TPA: hypothetical protein VEG37_09380 [Burkholderiales bacterium]|nr:hypothetical protein [Burkholderiales bacterium]
MRLVTFSLLVFLFPVFADAQTVYESKDKEGPVFSDTPSPGAQPIDLPPANVINTPAATREQQQQATPGYTAFTILSPQNQSTVHTNTGKFQVSLRLTPALQSGNAISVTLDGTTLPTLHNSLKFHITSAEWQSAAKDNVMRELQVAVLDGAGNTLITAPSAKFYVHRTAVGGSDEEHRSGR